MELFSMMVRSLIPPRREMRSLHIFKPDPVQRSQIERIVDVGRMAAAANTIQPWGFVVVIEEGTRKKIAGITDYGKFIGSVPVGVVILCKDIKYFLEDKSTATQSMPVPARALSLDSCWIAGDEKGQAEAICALLGLPPGLQTHQPDCPRSSDRVSQWR